MDFREYSEEIRDTGLPDLGLTELADTLCYLAKDLETECAGYQLWKSKREQAQVIESLSLIMQYVAAVCLDMDIDLEDVALTTLG